MKYFIKINLVLIWCIPIMGEQLFWEDFSNSEIPPGWEMDGNWLVGSVGFQNHPVGDPPPGAYFYYSPVQYDYEMTMTTPVIDVGDESDVLVEFFFELDFWSAGAADTNGLKIEYLTGGEWVQVLGYEIRPGVDVDLSGRYESFTAEINGDFKIRWVAYGTNSNYINSWDVDNISVLTLPKLTNVSIESSNEDPSTAYLGTNIWLNFSANSEFNSDPYVQINGNLCNVDHLGGTNWVAYYTVQESDPDGPLQFTIDFIDINGAEGKTVKETTNGSVVIVDNSPPPSFTVGTVTSSGGNAVTDIWNSTNTQINLVVNIPEDSAVTSFNYTPGNSLSFDGTIDELIIPAIPEYQVTEALTVEMWIKPNSWSDNDGIFNYARDSSPILKAGFGFIYFATGWRFFLKTNNNAIDYLSMPEVSTPSGQWTHLAATYDGERVRLYRNGTLTDSSETGAAYSPTGPIRWLGAPSEIKLGSFTRTLDNGSGDVVTGYFNGQIDEFRIWNITRSAAQIKASKEATINNNELGLLGYWRMDGGAGSTVTDSTATGNHGILSGPDWVIEDSPINFQSPVWDTDVIVGSAFQLIGRVSNNEFEAFGQKDTITVDDLNASVKTVFASSDAFEGLTDFAHEETAQFSALLFDVAGNNTSGDISTTNMFIDILASSPDQASISSNNNFSHLAKTGDEITITMIYDEDVVTPTVTVDGNNADDVSDLGGEEYSSTYILTGGETEGSLPFILSTTDYLGNDGTHLGSTDGSSVVYDRTEPIVSPVSIQSTNKDNKWAKIGDTVKIDFGGNEILYEVSTALAGSELTIYDSTDAEYDGSDECVGGGIVTENLKLWLDANDVDGDGASEGMGESTLNGSEVAIWADKSGNGADVIEDPGKGLPVLVQNQFNGQSALQFNKSEQDVLIYDLSTSNWTAAEFSIFIVFQQVGAPAEFDSFFSNGDINNDDHFQITHKTNNGHFKFLTGVGDEIDFEPWDNDLKLYGIIANSEGTSTIVDGNVANWAAELDGRVFSKYKINRNRMNGQYNDSFIAEVLLYDRELNASELTKTYKYLGNKYGKSFASDSTVVYTKKEMTNTDPEGEVAINFEYNDCAGNDGTTVTGTTDGSYVIFDRSPPSDFIVGDVTATSGNVVENAWNSTNTGLDITVPVASDTTLKNGWIQIWAKIGSNPFEELGDSSDITQAEVGTGKIISFTAEQVEAITGFTEEDTITIKAVMFDRPGNQTEGSQSVSRLVIDQISPAFVNSHIESNNQDSTKAKVDDVITITFEVDELIQTPTLTISGGDGLVTDLGSFNWSGTYTMTETDDEGIVSYIVNQLVDARGNPADGFTTTSDGSKVVFDRTKPILDQVNAQTNNPWNSQWALENDSARLYVNASEGLLSINCTFNGFGTTGHQYGPDEFDLGYTFSNTDTEGLIQFGIAFVDSAGNSGDTVRSTTDNTYIIFDQTSPSDFTVGAASSIGGNAVDNIWNSTNTGLDIIVPIDSDTTLDSGRVQIWAKVGSNSFEMLGNSSFILTAEVGGTKTMSITGESVRQITGFAENDTITLKARLFDIPGNETVGNESSTKLLIDETPPSLVSVSYESDFSDSSLATVGNVITLTFETDVEILTPTTTISNNSANISNLGSNRWSGAYTMQESDEDGVIPFQIGTLTDYRGNPTEGSSETTDGTQVTFDNTAPTLNPVSILSNNPSTEWAKVGDTVIVTFTAEELLSSQIGSIVNQSAIISDLGNQNYTAAYAMDDGDPEGNIIFEIIVTDSVGIESSPIIETTDESYVIFDRTLPTLSMVHIESNNDNNTVIAVGGNEVYLSFTPEEPLIMDSIVVTIAEQVTTLTELGGTYTATLTISGNEPEGILEFTIDFRDRAGNSGIQVMTTTDESYVNHDIYPPEIESTSISSSGTDTTWAKIGDSVFVTFKASEVLDEITITIAGAAANYDELSLMKYRGYHIMEELDNEGEIPFLISYSDLGGAIGADADTTTNNSRVRFDKTVPEISSVRMATNNLYGDSLAGIGTVDTIFFSLSEPRRELNVEIADQTLTPIKDALNYSAIRTFTDDDLDGWVSFSLSMTDSAGNGSDTITTTQDGSKVRFDGTPPSLTFITFFSNNNLDTTLSILGDSLFLQYTSSETLRAANITIANNPPNETSFIDGKYQAVYIVTGIETEGFIPFSISGLEDWVGNIGEIVNTTSNSSSVLFDMTPPTNFTLGEVTSRDGIEISGFWNSSNQTLDLIVPISNDETLPNGGIQLQSSFGESFSNLADTVLIEEIDLGTNKTISVSEIDFESVDDFIEGGNASFQALIWDKAGNTTIGTVSSSTIHIDEILPTLELVSQRTNNAIADSLAKVGDTDTLSFTSSEGLDSIHIQMLNQDGIPIGENREWTLAYTFQETDDDGLVNFNIVFGDSAGNLGLGVSETTDGSQVRFDGTNPTLTSVAFLSTNELENDLATIGDTLVLDFNTDEDLYSSEVTIAGFIADTTYENPARIPYRSMRLMNGEEEEGYIPFMIVYTDLVGNIGDTIEATTDASSVLFDMTPPTDFVLGEVLSKEGTEVDGYWNSSNQSLMLIVPVDNDETLVDGGIQIKTKFGENISIITDTILIEQVDLGTEKNVIIPDENFESSTGFLEGENATFEALIWDKAGNTTAGTASMSTIHIDQIVPTLDEIKLYSNNELDTTWAKMDDEVTLDFISSEGLNFVNAVLALDSLVGTGTNAGRYWRIAKTVTETDAEDTILFNITFLDTAGNTGTPVTTTSDNSFLILDKTKPMVTNLLEGNEGLDIDYYNRSDSITLYWNSFDSLAGVRDGYVALGTDSNLTDILNWTLTTYDSLAGLGGLTLSNDGIYYGGVFVRDSAGNLSDTIWGNSIYIDVQNPDTGSIIDAYWVMDLDYAVDSTRLSYIWSNFSDNSEIDYYQLAIGTGDDTTNVLDWMRSDSTDSMTVTGLSLLRDTLYYTYIRAIDLATNQSHTARTDGIYFDDLIPIVKKITPNVIVDSAKYLSVLDKDTLTIKFNRPIYQYDLSIKSVVDTNFIVSHTYEDSVITVIWTDTLASYDTLTVIVDSAVAYNTLQVTDTIQFFSRLWADLNDDYDITVDDILAFNQTWPETDLGPIKGDPPHVRPSPDDEADLTDLAAFGKMWNWRYFKLDFDSSLIAAKTLDELSFSAQGEELVMNIPKNVYTAELLIGESNMNVMEMKMVRPRPTTFMFTATDTTTGLIQFSIADRLGFDSTLTLILPSSDQELFQTRLQYEFKNRKGMVLQKGITYIDVEILPEKFSVYNNYPNPFNPVTTIRYDLPDIRNVNIVIYDLLGRTVKTLDLNDVPGGRHEFKWYGENQFGNMVSTGIYFLQLTAGQEMRIQKMLLLK